MNTYPSASLDDSTGSAATSLGDGSKDSGCEQPMAAPAPKDSPKDVSPSGPADIREPIFGFGTMTGCTTHEPFAIRQSGNIGQEILDQDGKIIAWTTDAWIAQVICKLLNEHEELLTT